MRDTIRNIRNFGIYLLPASSLAVAGALLLGLLNYPAPPGVANTQPRPAIATEHQERQARADALFAALLADALRQLQAEQEQQVRTLRYHYEQDHSSGEAPVMLWIAPPPAPGTDWETGHPALIHL